MDEESRHGHEFHVATAHLPGHPHQEAIDEGNGVSRKAP
jgi:hypothetical protein